METAIIEAPQAPAAAAQPEQPVQAITFQRPELYPLQEAAIFDPARYSIIEASTKAGKTSGCLIWIAEKAVTGRPGWHYWWVSPIFAQAKIAFRRLKESLNPASFRANESELTITLLATRTVIDFKGADKPDSLYGEDVYAVVIDEASRVKEESWHAVRTTMTATKGPIRIIGNKKGKKNWFYKLARKAAGGEKDMAYHKLTADDAVAAGILAQEEIDDARAKLPDHVFRQLYNAEDVDDEGNPFGDAQITACTVTRMSSLPPVVWGWDFAKSHDWTVGVGLDRQGDVCRLERFQKPWGHTKQEVKRHTGQLPAGGDSTGVGDPVVESLQTDFGVNIEGFVYTSRSKQQLMEGLAADIQQQATHFPEGVLTEELHSFEYHYSAKGVTYGAPEGMFDDCVNALAIARAKYRAGGYNQPFVATSVRTGIGPDRIDPELDGTGETGPRDIWRSGKASGLMD